MCSSSKCVGCDGILLQKRTGHGRFRDSSALSAAVAALAAAQEGVQPARATNCNATNDPLTALPSDSLPVKQAKRNLRNIVEKHRPPQLNRRH